MAITPCPKCGFPMVKQMSSKPDSTATVFYCFNCGLEIESVNDSHTSIVYTPNPKENREGKWLRQSNCQYSLYIEVVSHTNQSSVNSSVGESSPDKPAKNNLSHH